jgi:hypothetical protein
MRAIEDRTLEKHKKEPSIHDITHAVHQEKMHVQNSITPSRPRSPKKIIQAQKVVDVYLLDMSESLLVRDLLRDAFTAQLRAGGRKDGGVSLLLQARWCPNAVLLNPKSLQASSDLKLRTIVPRVWVFTVVMVDVAEPATFVSVCNTIRLQRTQGADFWVQMHGAVVIHDID